MDGRCWDRLARSSGLLYPAWVLSAVRRGKQRQFVCWIQVRSTDGKVKLARCLIDNGSEVNLVRKGFLQEDETKMSSTPVQLEGVSGHRLDGGDREAELAVRLVKQSVWSVEETVTEEWFAGKFYEASIKYDLFLGQPWLHAHRVSPMGHRTCFLQDPSTNDPSELYYLHPYSIVYRGDVSVRKRSARHNTCCVCCFKTRSTRSTCRTQTTHASRAERAERAAQRSRGRLRSRLPARAKRVARVARHYCTRAHFWGAASSQFGYPAYAVVPQGSHWSHG